VDITLCSVKIFSQIYTFGIDFKRPSLEEMDCRSVTPFMPRPSGPAIPISRHCGDAEEARYQGSEREKS